MSIAQNPFFFSQMDMSVGGNVYVPPTACLRSAYNTARAAACVERTGRARANEIQHAGLARRALEIMPFSEMS